MIWSAAEIIAELSTLIALAPGDLIFTGTPAGVGSIARGEAVRARLFGVEPLEVRFEQGRPPRATRQGVNRSGNTSKHWFAERA